MISVVLGTVGVFEINFVIGSSPLKSRDMHLLKHPGHSDLLSVAGIAIIPVTRK